MPSLKDDMESNPSVIQSFTRYVAKDTAFAAEYEDAFCVGLEQGRAAIADGVSSAIFSGRWARILVKSVVENPPDLEQPAGWVHWLADPRRRWLEEIDFARMPTHQKNKLRQVGGAYCTLCWVEFLAIPDSDADGPRWSLRAHAMGDSCILYLRSGQLLASFPMTNSAEFDLDPDSICSVATSRDGQQRLASTQIECQDGDVIVMITDAIGKWMLDSIECGSLAPWEQLWSLDESEWIAAIEHLRDTNAMKRDDTTMVVLQVGSGTPVWSLPRPALNEDAELLPIDEDVDESEAVANTAAIVVDATDNSESEIQFEEFGIEEDGEPPLETTNVVEVPVNSEPTEGNPTEQR